MTGAISAPLRAYCEKCKSPFEIPNVFGLGPGASVSVGGGTAKPCPTCGGVGIVIGGVYECVADIVTFIRASGASKDDLQRASEILRQPVDNEALAAQIDKEVPVLRGLMKFCEKYRDVIGAAGTLAGIVGAVVAVVALQSSLSDTDVARIATEAVAVYENTHPTNPPASIEELPKKRPLAHAVKRVTRPSQSQGAPCFCGSGKKFKLCHGTKRFS